jgi:hypothetical protein
MSIRRIEKIGPYGTGAVDFLASRAAAALHEMRTTGVPSTRSFSGGRLYFSYSLLLDPAVFESWRRASGRECLPIPRGTVARAIGVDLAFNSPSQKWGGRIAGLIRRRGKAVFGRLYQIPEKTFILVEQFESGYLGERMAMDVDVSVDGHTVKAVTFSTRNERVSAGGQVSNHFMNFLLTSAQRAGLPTDWLTQLKTEAAIVDKLSASSGLDL